ncbi:MAG: hypothetical protein GX868_12375, partial [Actinobacteria bacterium]|nr:hypothetical protein [Actinomycetota bacterium]
MSSTPKRLYRVQTDFDFTKLWRWMLLVSAVSVVVSVLALAFAGLNLSIDFRGGAVFEVPSEHMTEDDALAVLTDFDKVGGSKIQQVTDSEGTTILRIQAEKAKDVNESTDIREALAKAANEGAPADQQIEVGDVGVNTVGPSWGEAITRDAVKALIVFLIVIAGYLTWTLESRMALAAMLSVGHDVLLTLGLYAIFRFEV